MATRNVRSAPVGLEASASVRAGRGVKVEKTITINLPQEDLYRYWRSLENLPYVMSHLRSVTILDSRRSHWVAEGPLGMNVEWDAEINNERENELIAWRSLPQSEVDTAGSVHFRPAAEGRGTVVAVSLKYDPPLGKAGAALAKLFGKEPSQEIEEDLQRLKDHMEAGKAPPGTT